MCNFTRYTNYRFVDSWRRWGGPNGRGSGGIGACIFRWKHWMCARVVWRTECVQVSFWTVYRRGKRFSCLFYIFVFFLLLFYGSLDMCTGHVKDRMRANVLWDSTQESLVRFTLFSCVFYKRFVFLRRTVRSRAQDLLKHTNNNTYPHTRTRTALWSGGVWRFPLCAWLWMRCT
jgi:hypothetical protein